VAEPPVVVPLDDVAARLLTEETATSALGAAEPCTVGAAGGSLISILEAKSVGSAPASVFLTGCVLVERQRLRGFNHPSTRSRQRPCKQSLILSRHDSTVCGCCTEGKRLDHSVSVVVITRDRPRDLKTCLSAVLAGDFQDFELVVVDQSALPHAADIVLDLSAGDPRIRLVRDSGRGAARARNIGAEATTGDIVVFTDDDCEPARDWLGTMVQAMLGTPEAALAFGTVTPAPHNPKDGFIVGFSPRRQRRLKGRMSKLRDAGISANVAVRRSAMEATGGFDEMLGSGSYFPSAEDFDLTYRVLSHGYSLMHVPEAEVLHHGLRDWQSGSGLVYRTYVAIGAAYLKHIRLGDAVGAALLVQEVVLALGNIARHLLLGRGPFGFGRLRGLFSGAWRSFELDVVPNRAVYGRPRPTSTPPTNLLPTDKSSQFSRIGPVN
jgi:GT2 family glycosyltransferase